MALRERLLQLRISVAHLGAVRLAEHDQLGALGELGVELLEPTSPDSPIAKFIEKRGEGLHHITLATGNLTDQLKRLKAAGVNLIDEKPRIGAGGAGIAFVHPKSTGGVLLELCDD